MQAREERTAVRHEIGAVDFDILWAILKMRSTTLHVADWCFDGHMDDQGYIRRRAQDALTKIEGLTSKLLD